MALGGWVIPSDERVPGLLTWLPGDVQIPQLSFNRQSALRKLEITLVEWANTEVFATWLSRTLSTITSDTFTELVISIARVTFSFHITSESQVRQWNTVDNVLDRLSLCEDVTLVVRPQFWVIDDKFKELVGSYFPLMWENGRVVLEGLFPHMKGGPMERMRICSEQSF